MIGDIKENVIEWYTGEKRITATLTQKRFVNRVKKLAETPSNAVEIISENEDGSICAHLPLKALHLTIYGTNNNGFKGNEEEEEGVVG